MTKTTEIPTKTIEDFERIKYETLLDIIRRVIVNPGNAEQVAHALAKDYFPSFRISAQGKAELVRTE